MTMYQIKSQYTHIFATYGLFLQFCELNLAKDRGQCSFYNVSIFYTISTSNLIAILIIVHCYLGGCFLVR